MSLRDTAFAYQITDADAGLVEKRICPPPGSVAVIRAIENDGSLNVSLAQSTTGTLLVNPGTGCPQ